MIKNLMTEKLEIYDKELDDREIIKDMIKIWAG